MKYSLIGPAMLCEIAPNIQVTSDGDIRNCSHFGYNTPLCACAKSGTVFVCGVVARRSRATTPHFYIGGLRAGFAGAQAAKPLQMFTISVNNY